MDSVENYRPICLLSAFAKTFETAVHGSIFDQVQHIITPLQHGFFPARSIVTNLSCFTQFTSKALNCQQQVDVVYTDFAKAFDRLDHAILLLKLSELGFDTCLCNFIYSYLTDRQMYVEHKGNSSSRFLATSGAPQGSNLAPLLFSLFINDITNVIKSQLLLFADDLKIFRIIHSVQDCDQLQNDLDLLNTWCLINKLPLNIAKCKVMTFTLKKKPINFGYSLDHQVLERVDNVVDLGIVFDSKLSFNLHVDQVRASALKMLGFIFRMCKAFTNTLTLKILYYSYVRSKLDYGSLIWNPYYNEYINTLETIQRKFLKFVIFTSDGIYPPQGFNHVTLLRNLKLPALSDRRAYLGLTFLYKLCTNRVDCPELLSQLNFRTTPINTRFPSLFYLPTAHNNVMMRSPLYRICRDYNNLAAELDIFAMNPSLFSYTIKSLLYSYLD